MLHSVISNPEFTKSYQDTEVKETIVICLQMFEGLCLALNDNSTALIFGFCQNHFNSFRALMEIYHEYSDIELYIFLILKNIVRGVSYDQLDENQKQSLRNLIYELITTYSKHEVGRYRTTNAIEDEELFDDISAILDICTNLITLEFEGYGI